MLFTPLHDRVLVRRIEEDEAGARNVMNVKAGDKILFSKWSGTEIKIYGEELTIMKESDILGIMA